MNNDSNILRKEEYFALCDLKNEIDSRIRSQPGMCPSVKKVLEKTLRQICRLTSQPILDLRPEDIIRAEESRNRVVFTHAMRDAVIEFLGEIEAGEYPHDFLADEREGERCVFARSTDVFAKYIAHRGAPITHLRFKRWLLEEGFISDQVAEKAIGGRRVGHLNIFRIDRIKALSGGPSPELAPSPDEAAAIEVDLDEAEEVLALATVLKTYFLSPFKGRHFIARVKKKACLLATPEDVHAFCQHHHATMEIAAHRLGPRGIKKSLLRHGLLVAGNHGLKRDGKWVWHLMAFDVKLVEDFYGRYAPGPD